MKYYQDINDPYPTMWFSDLSLRLYHGVIGGHLQLTLYDKLLSINFFTNVIRRV